MKKLSMTFVGKLEITKYSVYLEDKNLIDAITEKMVGDHKSESAFSRLTLTIEPIEDAGLKVEVEE